MPRVRQVSQYGRPEYSAVRCLLFGANLTDVGILSYVCLLFPDGKNILAHGGCVFCIPTRPRPSTIMNQYNALWAMNERAHERCRRVTCTCHVG